ncbi:MAG: hypothetical protein K2V38_12520, partial [Gemmataceae bacterium]|nr:hypothetical protein [Gemmataceae bacterium]
MLPCTDWPDDDEEQRLFTALASGRAAWNDFAVRLLPLLGGFLASAFPNANPHDRETAAEDAIFSLLQRPEQFDPTRGRLGAFLRMSARRDLQNGCQKEKRAARAIPLELVAEPAAGAEETGDGPTWTDPRLATELASLDEAESATLTLMRAGERDTLVFARELGLTHLPAVEPLYTYGQDPQTLRAFILQR